VHFCVVDVVDEALATSVEERLGIFWLGPRLENFLMV
jgi:hypothetical protein